MRSRGKCEMGRARREREVRRERNSGEEYLNGALIRVSLRRDGQGSGRSGVEDAHGSQDASLQNPG